jgi:hypothetical protein
MNEFHDGRYPDYDIRERFPDDVIHPDDLPRRLSESDHWSDDEVNPNSDVNNDKVEGPFTIVFENKTFIKFKSSKKHSEEDEESAKDARLQKGQKGKTQKGKKSDSNVRNEPHRLSESDDEPSPCDIDVEGDEIITISDDDDVIIESLPDIIEIVEVNPDTAGTSKQPSVCLKLQKTQHEKKILLKEEPKSIVKRPYNLGNKCKLTGKEEEGNLMKKKRKVKLECEGRNIVKTYQEIPCTDAIDRANEEEEPDVEEVHKARREKGISKQSNLKRKKTCQPSTSGGNVRQQKGEKSNLKPKENKKTDVNNNSGFDVVGVATNLARNLQNQIRPNLRNTVLTLEVLAMTKKIFDNCAKIRLPKSKRKKRFGFLIPFLLPPLVGLTVVAVESHVYSGETHCPKEYIKFGKNCIPQGLCPKGYVKMNF